MHDFSPYYGPMMNSSYVPFSSFGFMNILFPFLVIVALWTIVLKGFALWHAARHEQKWWFIALLVVNTLGILEIIYLVWFRPSSPHARHRAHTPTHESGAKA